MSEPGRDSDEDVMVLVTVAAAAVAFGVVNIGAVSTAAAAWLLAHGLVVPEQAALVPLPGEVGLDVSRVVGLVGAVLLLVVLGLQMRKGRRTSRGPVR